MRQKDPAMGKDDMTASNYIPPADDATLYAYLRSQFTDLSSAKLWMHRWANDLDCALPEPFGPISSRAMAAHVSRIVEGKTPDCGPSLTNYLDERWGPILYESAWSKFAAEAPTS